MTVSCPYYLPLPYLACSAPDLFLSSCLSRLNQTKVKAIVKMLLEGILTCIETIHASSSFGINVINHI